MGRQGKRVCGKSETRRKLENDIIRYGKLEAIKLDDKVLEDQYHRKKERKEEVKNKNVYISIIC
jgi:hypothetical protein